MPETADRPELLILLGPTASGKERCALASAEALGGEIVSVDSMKIYRQLEIGTAKATAAMRARVPHHALDMVEPEQSFSVAEWVAVAEAAIADIVTRGKRPILSGGTALYYKGLLEGLFAGPAADPALREALTARLAKEGAEALYAELRERDRATADRLHANDTRRVIRALEVTLLTGEPISARQRQWGGGTFAELHPENATARYRYPFRMLALDWPRETLYARIERRVDRMMAEGLLEEARWVYERRETLAETLLQAVGYKELFPHLAGTETLASTVERLKINTRHLAKSQLTWFRKFPCTWLKLEPHAAPDDLPERVLSAWSQPRTATE